MAVGDGRFSMRDHDALVESGRRGAAAMHEKNPAGKPKVDRYERRLDIRRMLAEEDERRGKRCRW